MGLSAHHEERFVQRPDATDSRPLNRGEASVAKTIRKAPAVEESDVSTEGPVVRMIIGERDQEVLQHSMIWGRQDEQSARSHALMQPVEKAVRVKYMLDHFATPDGLEAASEFIRKVVCASGAKVEVGMLFLGEGDRLL